MPIPPAFSPRPLSFHADPTKSGYILHRGTACDGQGLDATCHDEGNSRLSDVRAWLGLALRAWAWLLRAWASTNLKPGPRPNFGLGLGLAWLKPGLLVQLAVSCSHMHDNNNINVNQIITHPKHYQSTSLRQIRYLLIIHKNMMHTINEDQLGVPILFLFN